MEKKFDVRDRLFKIISTLPEPQWEEPESTEKKERKFTPKRKYIRKDTSVYGIFETKNSQFRDFTKNVSIGGVLIDAETPLSFHEDIFITLFHENFSSPIRTNGKVARVDSDGIGIQFDQVLSEMSSL